MKVLAQSQLVHTAPARTAAKQLIRLLKPAVRSMAGFFLNNLYLNSMTKFDKHVTEPAQLLARIQTAFRGVHWQHYIVVREGWNYEVIILDQRYVFRLPNDAPNLAFLPTEIAVL